MERSVGRHTTTSRSDVLQGVYALCSYLFDFFHLRPVSVCSYTVNLYNVFYWDGCDSFVYAAISFLDTISTKKVNVIKF